MENKEFYDNITSITIAPSIGIVFTSFLKDKESGTDTIRNIDSVFIESMGIDAIETKKTTIDIDFEDNVSCVLRKEDGENNLRCRTMD